MTGTVAPTNQPTRIFISGIASQTHILHVASYLTHALAATTGPVFVVNLSLGSFLGKSRVNLADLTSRIPKSDRLTIVDNAQKQWQCKPGEQLQYIAVGAPGIKPYSRLRLAAKLRPILVIVVDEGLGSYGNWQTRRDAWARESGRRLWPTVRALTIAAGQKVLTNVRWALFDSEAGSWVVNEAVAASLRVSLGGQTISRQAIFLSQPWVELGVMTENDYCDFLHTVSRICQETGLDFVLGLHPAERPERYREFEVLRATGPVEQNPKVISAKVLLGATSTALLNMAALYGVPAFRVLTPPLAHLEVQLSVRQRSLLDTFVPSVPVGEALISSLRKLS
jgi:Alpha-2,8-polysialyltransferase (POLYST)